jgi:hypothetical protein
MLSFLFKDRIPELPANPQHEYNNDDPETYEDEIRTP